MFIIPIKPQNDNVAYLLYTVLVECMCEKITRFLKMNSQYYCTI